MRERTARTSTPSASRAAAALALLLGTAAAATAAPPRPDLLAPCHVEGLEASALCGRLEVPEDRAQPQGRRIALRIVVVPSLRQPAEPDPLFVLVGGPGQAATEAGPAIVNALSKVRRSRDFVLVDQRGTGSSSPLDCSEGEADDPASIDDGAFAAERLQDCLDALDADPRQYTTRAAMDDLDDVRAALGYETINLWGGSYGTRAALVFARQHPDRLRAMVLDGVAPLQIRLPLFMARDGERAMRLLLDQCAADPGCAGAFPGLEVDLRALLARLREEPRKVHARHPRTGAELAVTIDATTFASGLRSMLYSSDLASLVPLVVCEAVSDRFEAFLASLLSFSGSVQMSQGMMLSVLCSEDVSRVSYDDLEAEARGTFVGEAMARPFWEGCLAWPHLPAAPEDAEPVVSDVPTLLLSGELDPVTPPSWGEATLPQLGRGRHLVVPGVGHGVSTVGCLPDLIARFLETTDAAALDAACTTRHARPPFFLDMAGPTP